MTRPRVKAYLALLVTAVIWGIASPVIKYTLDFVSPVPFLFWRFLLTSLIFLPIFLLYQRKKKIKLTLKKICQFSLLGFLGTTLSLGLLFVGYQYTTAIDGALIFSLAPLVVVVGGALFLKEKITRMEKIGSAAAFLGSIVVVIQPVLEGNVFAVKNIYGNLLIAGSAIVFAAYCLLVRQFEFKEKADPLVLTALGFFAGLATITPVFAWEQLTTSLPLAINPSALPGIIYMTLFSSVIAYFTYHLGYSLIEASEATIFDYLKPVFAAPIAILWLGEKITPPFLLGAGIIGLGVFLTEYRPQRLARKKKK